MSVEHFLPNHVPFRDFTANFEVLVAIEESLDDHQSHLDSSFGCTKCPAYPSTSCQDFSVNLKMSISWWFDRKGKGVIKDQYLHNISIRLLIYFSLDQVGGRTD